MITGLWIQPKAVSTSSHETLILYSPAIARTSSLSSSSSSSITFRKNHKVAQADLVREQQLAVLSCAVKRRIFCSLIYALTFHSSVQKSSGMASGDVMELERYTDSNECFTLLKPSSYIRVDKSGATVLFEEPNMGSNNVGIVINPVRLTTLREFGSARLVADKIIEAENRKGSTMDAELIMVRERSGMDGLQVYEFEYRVDSSRGGMKMMFVAAFVAFKKLYLLNISHTDKPEGPLDIHTRMKLEQVLHSFDVTI